VLSPGVHVHTGAVVEDSVLLNGVDVGRGAIVRRAIIDKNVRSPTVPDRGRPEADRDRFHVSDGGVITIGKGDHIDPEDGA
jgi:glucose-1-phosphate adenylyltransferase